MKGDQVVSLTHSPHKDALESDIDLLWWGLEKDEESGVQRG